MKSSPPGSRLQKDTRNFSKSISTVSKSSAMLCQESLRLILSGTKKISHYFKVISRSHKVKIRVKIPGKKMKNTRMNKKINFIHSSRWKRQMIYSNSLSSSNTGLSRLPIQNQRKVTIGCLVNSWYYCLTSRS